MLEYFLCWLSGRWHFSSIRWSSINTKSTWCTVNRYGDWRCRLMCWTGVSITVTSITDVVAFVISSTTVLPALSSFCTYAALGVLALYVLQVKRWLPSLWIICKFSYGRTWSSGPNRVVNLREITFVGVHRRSWLLCFHEIVDLHRRGWSLIFVKKKKLIKFWVYWI